MLDLVRQLDEAILHLRFNEPDIGTVIFKTQGDSEKFLAQDAFMNANADASWLINETMLYWKRTLKRIDLTSRTLFTFVEPGSCFVGVLAELLFAVDRTYMLEGQFEDGDNNAPAAEIILTDSNFGPFPMPNGITRLETRFLGEPESVDKAAAVKGEKIDAARADELGLITAAMDDIDWADEIRIILEERKSFSPDALTGMEANLRFAGPETMETKIFGRLTAWQNWIFQRPNAVGETGALQLYGTGSQPSYDKNRV
jgi:benzoyl-CoA-dihydrodiol lyase